MKLIISVFLLVVSEVSMASRCAWPRDSEIEKIKWTFKNADIVLIAKVRSFHEKRFEESEELIPPPSKDWGLQFTKFEKKEVLKGKITDNFTTRINSNCSLCGYKFIVGEQYLLYLSGPDEEGYFHTGVCSGTTLASRAKKEIETIRGF